MNAIRVLTLAVALTLPAPGVLAAIRCGEPCMSLVQAGHALEGQGKYQEALDKYKLAEQADRKASIPVSLAAGLLYKLSTATPAPKNIELRDMARAGADHALGLDAGDPVAQEVLRMLDDNGPSPLRTPNAAAAKLLAEGEALFLQGKLMPAREKYEAATVADPASSGAWVGAADTYFLQKDWPRAAELFRKATEVEPHNAQAWRFLSDALLQQGQHAQAEAVLYSSLEADPSQRPTWGKLGLHRARAGMPLKALALRRGVRVVPDANGKLGLEIDKATADQAQTPDYAFRIALGAAEIQQRGENTAGTRSPFEIELQSWKTALKVVAEAHAGGAPDIADPALITLRKLDQEGQLEPALLILLFRQAYRPALDAWVRANPGGVKHFIDRYGLQP